MASTAAVLSVLVKSDTSKAVTGLTALQKKLESASKSADELTDKLFYLSQLRITPKIDLDTGRADEQVDALQGKLDRLGTGKTTATVEAATAHAREEIDRLANSDFTVHGSVDLDTGAAEAKIQLLKRQAAGIGGGIGGGVSSGGSSGGSAFAPLSFAFANPIATGIALGAPLLPTVGASLVQGALGAGALGTAAAGAGAVGGAGIASVAVGGLGDITKALAAYTTQQQAAGAQAVQSAQQQLSAASAQHAAAQQVQTAEESLTTAQQQETFAQQALTLARKDAVRQLTDMRRAATESTTAEQQAKLNLEVARRALAQAPAGTSALELKQLQLSAKEAQQAFRDAGIARDRAHQDANKAQSQGVSQMPQVVAAQRSLASAQKAVADASNNVKQAEYAQAQASKQAALQAKALAISQGQVGIAMKELPQSGREATKSIVDLKDAWEKLSKPAANQFFGLISDGVHEMDRLLPMFARSAESSVGAVRDAFDKFLRSLNSPGFQKFIDTMTKTFAAGIGPLTKGFTNLLVILERIAIAAAPGLLKLLQGFREMTGDWLQSTANAQKLQVAVAGVIRQFTDWLGLLGAVGEVLSALFIANTKGAKAGGNAVKQLTGTLQGWADWINSHRHKVNEFFINLLHTVEILAGALGNLAMTLAPLSSAMVPISKGILAITTALNNLKIGPISALTALLGSVIAVSAFGKLKSLAAVLGIGGAAAAGGGEAAAAVTGGEVAGGTAAAGGLSAAAPALAVPAAVGITAAFGFQQLFGKQGTPLATASAGIVPPPGQYHDQIKTALKAQQDYHGKTLAQITDLRDQANAQWMGLWETDPAKAQSAGAEDMKRTSKDTAAQLTAIIHAKKIGAAFADSVAEGGPALKRQLGKVSDAFAQESTAQQNHAIHSAKSEMDSLRKMNLISWQQEKDALKKLGVLQDNAQKDQKQKWDRFGLAVNKLVAGWFGGMTQTVDQLLGNKGITGMVNQLLTGVASQKTLKWNPTTVGQVAGHLAGFLNIGGAKGGFLPGYSKEDNIPMMARGGEAILRPEDHVPMVNRAMHKTYGMGLNEMFHKTGAGVKGMAKGGYVYPFSKSMPLGRIDQGVDANTPGAPIGAIGDASVVNSNNYFAPAYGSANQGMVYRLRKQPTGFSPSSPYVFIYEGLDKVGGASGQLKAGQLLGHIHASYPGIEMGWAANATGATLASVTSGYTEGQETPAGKSFMAFLQALASGKAVGGAAAAGIGSIPKIIIKGPKGSIRSSLQGIADKARKAANAYLAKQQPKGAAVGSTGTFPATKGGWHRVGATYEGLDGQQGAYGTVGGLGFAELLLAGANAGMHPNLEDVLGTKIPPLGKVAFRMPGSNRMATAVKNDIGSGQPGSGHYLVDIQTGLAKAIGWHPNQDVLVKAMRRGGFVMPPFGGSFATGGVVPGPIGSPRTVVAHGGETVSKQGSRYQITITNWKEGTGHMEEIADGAVNGQRRLNNQLSRMRR